MTNTFGPAYSEQLDRNRILTQMEVLRDYMLKQGWWLSLAEIEKASHYPQASISAQLRHLRKIRFGGYCVDKRRRANGAWEYRVLPPEARTQKQATLFGEVI